MPRRPPVFTPLPLGDPKLDRLQIALQQSLQALDDRLESVASPVVAVALKDHMVGASMVVDYRGAGGHQIILPPAIATGKGRARVVHILNNGQGTIALTASGNDTLNGASALDLAAGDTAVVVADGFSGWLGGSPQSDPGAAPDVAWSIVAAGRDQGVTATSGNFTVGMLFNCSRVKVCTGIRVAWKSPGSSKTLRMKLWSASGALASVDVTAAADGVFTGTFASPVTLDKYKAYKASVWDTSGSTYPVIAPSLIVSPTGASQWLLVNPYVVVMTYQRFSAGDSNPTGNAGSELYPVEPVIEGITPE